MGKIYHYTSTQSFESIIKNNCIRMTRSDFMNDPHDCRIFFEIVENYINERAIEYFIHNVKLNHETKTLDIIENFPVIDYMKFVYSNIPTYLLSLTTESDSLPMWNYYGGEGLRLSFDDNEIFLIISNILCTKEFQFAVYTEVDYISPDKSITDLTLDSFSNFQVREYDESNNCIKIRPHSIQHRDGQNLKHFIDSYVKSYIKTIDFAIEESYRNGVESEENIPLDSANSFFQNIFIRHKNVKNNADLKFKTDIDLYTLILAARYKPATFQNEKEFRIVFFDYDFDPNVDECYCVSHNRFGACLKPFIECKFKEWRFAKSIKDIVLSPITTKMPLEIDTYKKVICDFANKNGGQLTKADIKASEHNIRW